MNRHRKFRIRIDDESHLSTLADITLSPAAAVAAAVALFAAMLLIAGAMVTLTPLRTLLPGYLNESQRVASEEHSPPRLLREKYSKNQKFIDNYLRVTDIDRTVSDSVAFDTDVRELTPRLAAAGTPRRTEIHDLDGGTRALQHLCARTACRRRNALFAGNGRRHLHSRFPFRKRLESSLCPKAPRCRAPLTEPSSEYITPLRAGIRHSCPASQRVSLRILRRRHAFGVDRRRHRLRADHRALPEPDSRNRRTFTVRLWHNGLPVVPYEYVGSSTSVSIPETTYEAPRGR